MAGDYRAISPAKEPAMPFSQLPALLSGLLAPIAAALERRSAPRLLRLLALAPGDHLLFALDDTPTARYGPCVQGAGVHHNPSPGPAGEKFVYGHVWVALAWLARHSRWDTLSLPLRALLYVRKKDLPRLAKACPWEFRTKLELAAEQFGHLGAKDVPPSPPARPAGLPREGTTLCRA
jgi:hypothetical protein